MGNWSIYGIFLIIGLFFALTGFLLSQIDVTNPFTGQESSIVSLIWDWINPF